MTRRRSILAYSLVLALALLGLQSWSIALGRIEKHVLGEIAAATGLVVQASDRAEIALLPLPRISLSEVRFSRPDGLLAGTATRLRARARLLPLLTGRLALDRIELVQPEIDVANDGDGQHLGDWLSPPLEAFAGLPRHGRILISGGSFYFRTQGAIRTIVREVNLVLDERAAGEPVRVSGSALWRGVANEYTLIWPVADGREKLAVAVSSPLGQLRFDGSRSGASDPVIAGKISLSSKDLPAFLELFGERTRLAGALGGVDLAAEVTIKGREASLDAVEVSLDGDRLGGVLKVADAGGGRWALSGTLAGSTLDIDRLTGRIEPAGETKGEAAAAAIDFPAWTAQDVDLRISVDQARLRQAQLSEVAGYVLVKKGRFEAGLVRAGAYGGTAKGRLLAVAAPLGVDVKLQAALDRVNAGQAAADLPRLGRLAGLATLNLALDGFGTTAPAILNTLSGKAAATIRNGEIGGIALADLLRRAERAPLTALRDLRQGRSPFETLSFTAQIANGIAWVGDGQVLAPGFRLAATGSLALARRQIDLTALLSQPAGPQQLGLTLRGSLDEPRIEFLPAPLVKPANETGPQPTGYGP